MDSLLQNVSALDAFSPAADRPLVSPTASTTAPAGGAQAACAQFGLQPDSDSFASCVADLDATIFEAAHPIPG